MASTSKITGAYAGKVDTTKNVGGYSYPREDSDKNMSKGRSAILKRDYVPDATVKYTGIISANAFTTVDKGACMEASSLSVTGLDLAIQMGTVHISVISSVGASTTLDVRVGSTAHLRSLVVGESITIPLNATDAVTSVYVRDQAYEATTDYLNVEIKVIGPKAEYKTKYALDFDDNSAAAILDCGNISSLGAMSGTNGFTLGLWIKGPINTMSPYDRVFAENQSSTTSEGWRLRWERQNDRCIFESFNVNGVGAWNGTMNGSIALAQTTGWNHLVLTVDFASTVVPGNINSPGFAHWYFNGSSKSWGGSYSGAGLPIGIQDWSDANFSIGNSVDPSYIGAEAIFDNVSIWDTMLTQSEITSLYNSGIPAMIDEDVGNYTSKANLKVWWKMDEGSGSQSANAMSSVGTITIPSDVVWSNDVAS